MPSAAVEAIEADVGPVVVATDDDEYIDAIADYVRSHGSASDDEINFALCMATEDGYRRLATMVRQKWLTCEIDDTTGGLIYKALVRSVVPMSASVTDPFDDVTNIQDGLKY